MGEIFVEYKIRAKSGWLSSGKFDVLKLTYKADKTPQLLDEKVLFSGDIVSCKAFLDMFNDGNIINNG